MASSLRSKPSPGPCGTWTSPLRYANTARDARLNLGIGGRELDCEVLDVFDAKRLYIRRNGFHRREQVTQASGRNPCGLQHFSAVHGTSLQISLLTQLAAGRGHA